MEHVEVEPSARRGSELDFATKLDHASVVLKTCVPVESPLVARLVGLQDRFQHSRFQLAVLGQFKRGKSTFINALLGAPLLPMAVVPLTAIPTFVSWGRSPVVRVHFFEGPSEEFSAGDSNAVRELLFRFVAEEANPKNRLGVDRVDLHYPASMLADGTVLIDTPGIGSTLRHNTETAVHILPECDAVLFVISADPPITEAELEYVRRLKSKTSRLLFVLNKIDYLQPKERKHVAEFLQHTLEQNGLWPSDAEIFSISARSGLAAKQKQDASELRSSGILDVETYLARRLAAQKGQLLKEAIRSKALDILARAADEVNLRVRALEIPLEDLASKSQAFEESLRSIEERKRVIKDLLAGERQRSREHLEGWINQLRQDVSRKLATIIDEIIEGGSEPREGANWRALTSAMEQLFDTAREKLWADFTATVNSVLSAHQRRIDELVDKVRRTAAELFDMPIRQAVEPEPFVIGEEPYWVTENCDATLLPDLSRFFDRFLSIGLRARRLRKRMIRQTNELIIRNAENLRWAVLRGIDETFMKAALRLEERLEETLGATQRAIQETLALRQDKSFRNDPDLKRLAHAKTMLGCLQKELCSE